MFDIIAGIFGITKVHIYEFLYNKNYLRSRIDKRPSDLSLWFSYLLSPQLRKILRDMGIKIWDLNIAVLSKQKLQTKEDVRRLSKRQDGVMPTLKLRTSGSTGEPLLVKVSFRLWIEEQARVYASFRLGGYRIGKKMVVFRSYAPSDSEGIIKRNVFRNWVYFSSFHTDGESLWAYYEFLVQHDIKYIRTYASTLDVLLSFLEDRGLRLSLEMVHLSSERLSRELFNRATRLLNCRIVNYYGQVEMGLLGVNMNGGYGLDLIPYSFFRLDKNGQPIVTNILNSATPLLNYKLTDILIRRKDGLYEVIGRSGITLVHENGTRISTVNIFTLLQDLKRVSRWQVVQGVDLNISINYHGDISNDDRISIVDGIQSRLGKVKVSFCNDGFITSGEGKVNPIVRLTK